MNYMEIKDCDIANGPGVRVSLFVAGCDKHCHGCFNPETWDDHAGYQYTQSIQNDLLEQLDRTYIKGLTLIGGEPIQQNKIPILLELCRKVNARFNSDTKTKDIWCYTGNTWEGLLDLLPKVPELEDFLREIDVLVDGPFEQDLADLSIKFRGSRNQRIILPNESLDSEHIILWEDSLKNP